MALDVTFNCMYHEDYSIRFKESVMSDFKDEMLLIFSVNKGSFYSYLSLVDAEKLKVELDKFLKSRSKSKTMSLKDAIFSGKEFKHVSHTWWHDKPQNYMLKAIDNNWELKKE